MSGCKKSPPLEKEKKTFTVEMLFFGLRELSTHAVAPEAIPPRYVKTRWIGTKQLNEHGSPSVGGMIFFGTSDPVWKKAQQLHLCIFGYRCATFENLLRGQVEPQHG